MFSYLDTFTKIYLIAVCALFGLVMGSALNCLAYRIAHKEKWSGGRSRCPDCGHTLKAADLIPLFSYLFLKGRCRYCGKKISPRYPIAEALLAKGALLGVVLAFMMAVTTLSLPSLILLRKAVKPRLLALFTAICTLGIVLVGYVFNALSPFLL